MGLLLAGQRPDLVVHLAGDRHVVIDAKAPMDAYLDAMAHQRGSLGLPALSVNWGAWQGGGMAADAATPQRWRRAGIEPWAWVVNNSLAAAGTTDPLLRRRAANEHGEIHRVLTEDA